MDALWSNWNLLILSITAFLSVSPVIAFIPLKKVPSVIKPTLTSFFQKLYILLIVTLFLASLSTGLYIVTSYDLLINKSVDEIYRALLLIVFIISLLFTTLDFKRQKLSKTKTFFHLTISSCVLVLVPSTNIFDFYQYAYIFIILAVFLIMRYVVGVINKNF